MAEKERIYDENYDLEADIKNDVAKYGKEKKVTKEQLEEILADLDYFSKLEEYNLPDNDEYVIFTDGDSQLKYEYGEFFVESATEYKKRRKKITKDQARDMYLDFFMKYQLNPILGINKTVEEKVQTRTKAIEKQTQTKEVEKEEVEIEVAEAPEKKEVERDDLSL